MNGTKNICVSITLTLIDANTITAKENSNAKRKYGLLFSRVMTAAINAPIMVPNTIMEVKLIVKLGLGRIATIIVRTAQKSLGSPNTRPIV